MIKVKFALLWLAQKQSLTQPPKPLELCFGKASKKLHAVDVGRALRKLIVPVMSPKVVVVATSTEPL